MAIHLVPADLTLTNPAVRNTGSIVQSTFIPLFCLLGHSEEAVLAFKANKIRESMLTAPSPLTNVEQYYRNQEFEKKKKSSDYTAIGVAQKSV